MTQRSEYIEKMELQLDKLNKKMHNLESSAKDQQEDAHQKYKEEMSKLRQQSKVAAAKLDELKASGLDTWESLVTDMEKMYDAYTHSFFALFQPPNTSDSDLQEDKPPHKGVSDAHKESQTTSSREKSASHTPTGKDASKKQREHG